MIGILGFILCLILAVILYFSFVSVVNYVKLKRTEINFLTPIPLFGNLFNLLIGREHTIHLFKRIRDAFPDDRYAAVIEFTKHSIMIKDLELVKKVAIKDFDSFHDVPFSIDKDVDPIFGRILIILKGNEWRQMRAAVTPVFSSAKIKNMFSFMTECSDRMVKFYLKEIETNNKDTLAMDVELGDVSKRYTIDVLASSAFSLDTNSYIERDNEFFKQAGVISKQDIKFILKFAFYRLFPGLMKDLGITLVGPEPINYFRNLLLQTIKSREDSGEYRPDLIHLLIEAKKGTLKQEILEEKSENFGIDAETSSATSTVQNWTDDDLIAQAVMFILAGYNTSSSTLSFLFYELALHPDVQERLFREIQMVLDKSGGKINYSDITQMKYIDMVISETLRKWPPLPLGNRAVTKDYDLGPISDDNPVCFKVKKGDSVWIPTYTIHRDERYWPEPDVFDPERFSDENKPNIKPCSFIPFGVGPKNCIGGRFALLQMKIIIFQLLSKFSLEPCVKTSIPIKLRNNSQFLEPDNGFWLSMKIRND